MREGQGGFCETRVLRKGDRGQEVCFVCGGPAHRSDEFDDEQEEEEEDDNDDDNVGRPSSTIVITMVMIRMKVMNLH